MPAASVLCARARRSYTDAECPIEPHFLYNTLAIHRGTIVNSAAISHIIKDDAGHMDVILKDGVGKLEVGRSFQPRFRSEVR